MACDGEKKSLNCLFSCGAPQGLVPFSGTIPQQTWAKKRDTGNHPVAVVPFFDDGEEIDRPQGRG